MARHGGRLRSDAPLHGDPCANRASESALQSGAKGENRFHSRPAAQSDRITTMKTSAISDLAPELSPGLRAEFRGLDPKEQFAATIHIATEHYTEQGVTSVDTAYFLMSAARAALQDNAEFSANARLAREYLQAALELI